MGSQTQPEVLPRPIEAETEISPISAVWARVENRLDGLLLPAEKCVATLFEQQLDHNTGAAAFSNHSELALWLGDVGSPRAVTLATRLNEGLRRRSEQVKSDPRWAVDAAKLIEDIRGEVALSPTSTSSGARLLFVGPTTAESDAVVWAAVSAGFSIDLGEATPPDEPDIVVLVGDDVTQLMTTVHRVKAAHPDAAVVIAADLVEPSDQLALGSRCDVLITGSLRPLKVLDEVRSLLARRSVQLRFVQLTSDLGPLLTELETEGLTVNATRDVGEVLDRLETDQTNALLLTSSEPAQHAELINLVRSKPETSRTIIVECISRRRTSRTPLPEPTADSARSDVQVPLYLGAAGIASAAAEVVRRRSQLGAIDRSATPAGLPWFSGKARGEQLLLAAQRQDRPASLGLLRFAASVSVTEIDRIQIHLNRQFRDNDVVVRRNDHESLVVVDGIGRRTTMARLNAVIDQLVGVEVQACVGEQPYDGRDFEAVLGAIDAALDRSAGQDSTPVIGVDWQNSDLLSDHDVLLVEPDKSLAAVLRGGLRRLGLSSKSVVTADAALAELLDPTRRKPRLVVLEFDLPGLDGLSVLRRLDRAGALGRLNIMMLGSRTREVDISAAFGMGVVDIVAKPLSPQLTLHRIQRLLSQ